MDWFEFIKYTPEKISAPRIKGSAGNRFGFRQAANGSTLLQMIRAR